MKTIYDVTWFINKFEAIPEEKIIKFALEGDSGTHCSNGWCMAKVSFRMENTPESDALGFLFDGVFGYSITVARINNGDDPRYQQPTPKQRILAALMDIKASQHPAPKAPEVVERIVYVMVDSTVKELSGQLTNN